MRYHKEGRRFGKKERDDGRTRLLLVLMSRLILDVSTLGDRDAKELQH